MRDAGIGNLGLHDRQYQPLSCCSGKKILTYLDRQSVQHYGGYRNTSGHSAEIPQKPPCERSPDLLDSRLIVTPHDFVSRAKMGSERWGHICVAAARCEWW